jgi:hypothetical protein
VDADVQDETWAGNLWKFYKAVQDKFGAYDYQHAIDALMEL